MSESDCSFVLLHLPWCHLMFLLLLWVLWLVPAVRPQCAHSAKKFLCGFVLFATRTPHLHRLWGCPGHPTLLSCPLHIAGEKFDAKFGRDVLAQVLGVPAAADWKSCVRPSDEEKRIADRFKAKFNKFDWTLNRNKKQGRKPR